ncbi:MAG: glycosyltransferase family 61 protein [Chryseolinea sp.]
MKDCFLVYNKLKIRTYDKFAYSEVILKQEDFLTREKSFPFSEKEHNFNDLKNADEHPFLTSWYLWSEENYILRFNNCTLEPEHGWGLSGANSLLYWSLPFSKTAHQKKPTLIPYWLRKNVEKLDIAISFRDTGEENYFHFFNDILTKPVFLKQHSISVAEIPIVISGKLWHKPYFQYCLKNATLLQDLKWIIQDKQYIYCTEVIFCKVPTVNKQLLQEVFSGLRISAHRTRRIFLIRDKKRLRFLENLEEVEKVCRKFDIEVVDTDDFTFPEQIRIFSEASLIVGIHGAGLTNMMFRKGDCKVFELFPPPEQRYLPFHYAMMAKINSFEYRAMIGTKSLSRYSGGFRVDATKFADNLGSFMGYMAKSKQD